MADVSYPRMRLWPWATEPLVETCNSQCNICCFCVKQTALPKASPHLSKSFHSGVSNQAPRPADGFYKHVSLSGAPAWCCDKMPPVQNVRWWNWSCCLLEKNKVSVWITKASTGDSDPPSVSWQRRRPERRRSRDPVGTFWSLINKKLWRLALQSFCNISVYSHWWLLQVLLSG